jgi:hypothetical protein
MNGMFGDGFDCNAPENNEAGVIPAGEYHAVLVKFAKRESKKTPGAFYLWMDFQVVSGEFQNRHVSTMVNLWHPFLETVRIAKTQLSSLGRAVGVLNPKDPSEFLGKPLKIKVDLTEGKGDYSQQNVIKSFKPRDAMAPPPAPVVNSTPAVSATADANPFG